VATAAAAAGTQEILFPALVRAEEPIRIGQLIPFTGFLGAIGVYGKQSATLAVEELNARGGLLDRKLELITEDEANPGVAVQKARKLIERDKVVAIEGLVSSASCLAVGDEAQRARILTINAGANSDEIRSKRCHRYIFNTEGCNTQYVSAVGSWLIKARKVTSWYFITSDYAFGHDLLRVARNLLTSHKGTEVGSDLVPTGTADFSREGTASRAIPINATGHGRTMSMVAFVEGERFLGDVAAFFKELDLVVTPNPPARTSSAPPGVAAARSGPEGGDSMGSYVYAAPKGWTRTNYPDGAVYVSPPYPNTGENCQLSIFPMRAGSGDLLRDAIGAFQGLFKSDPMTRAPYPDPKIAKGTSPFGWEYLVLKKEIGGNGYYGETTTGVIVFVARLGSDVALIVGTSMRPLVSQCFGEAFPDQWPAFFHTLRFKSFK